MALNIKDLETILISKSSAIFFAVFGVALGSVAYLKFKSQPVAQAPSAPVDERDPKVIAQEKNIEKATQFIQQKLFKSAEEILSELYKEIPSNTYVLAMLALSEKKLGRLESAELHLREAITIEPGKWELHNNLGAVLFDKGRAVEALLSFEKALELSPKNHTVLLSQGKVQELIGKFTDARLSYGKAIESEGLDGETSSVIKDRLKRLDVLAYIERGDK